MSLSRTQRVTRGMSHHIHKCHFLAHRGLRMAWHMSYPHHLHIWTTHISYTHTHISLSCTQRVARGMSQHLHTRDEAFTKKNTRMKRQIKKLKNGIEAYSPLFARVVFLALSPALFLAQILSLFRSLSVSRSRSLSLSHTHTHALSLSVSPYIGSGTVVKIRQYGIIGLCAHEPAPALPTWFVTFNCFWGIHFPWKNVYHHTRHFKVYMYVRVCVCVWVRAYVCVCVCDTNSCIHISGHLVMLCR